MKPGYKQTDVGVFPEDWEIPRVGDVCGCIVPGRNKPKLFDGDIPWITTPDIEFGKPVSTSRLGLCISRAEAKSVGSKVVPPGSVLMSCAGELGIVALTRNEIVVNQQLHVFLPTARIDGTFLLSALSYRKDQIASLGTKTAVPYLNKSSCNSITIPLPPLPEQRAIAEALSDVDVLLGALDRLIAKKRDLKLAALQQLLTPNTGWTTVKLEQIAEVIDPHPSHRAPEEVANGIPFVGIGDLDEDGEIIGTKLRLVDSSVYRDHLSRYDLADGLIGLGRVASIGKVVRLKPAAQEYAVSPTLGVIRATKVNREYLLFSLRSKFVTEQFARIMSGSTRSSVGMVVLRKLDIALPADDAEQTAIAEVLGEMDAELAGLEQRREKTGALKQGMMQELLTGRTRLI